MRSFILSVFLLCSLNASAQMFLIFGTSIDRAVGATHPDSSWTGRLKKQVYPQLVINLAVSGSTYMDSIPTSTWGALKYAKLQNYNPTYIILGGGFNDSKFNPQFRFQREYRRFLDSVKTFWPHANIICNTPIKCRNYPVFQAMLDTVIVPVTIEEGYAAGARICNLSMLPNTVAGPDGVHPNDAGYLRMFRSWWSWFQGPIQKPKEVIIDPIDPAFEYAGRSFPKQIVFE
jgi:lysophospholipase L1-like esterase